jgi:predicted phage terminase large subunit-like protein
MGMSAFIAQYQQDPLPPEGDIIKVGWFRRYDDVPRDGQMVFSIDTANKAGLRNDWSVISVWRLSQQRFYLEYIWRRRVEYPELRMQVIELARSLRPDTILIEDKGAGIGLIQDLRADAEGFPIIAYDPGSVDKETRMRVQSAKIEGGQVFLPPDAPWLADFLGEVQRFPNGAHDDQIDAMSQLLDHASNRQPGKLLIIR